MRSILAALTLLFLSAPALAQQQVVDPDFRPAVARPAYAANSGPVVAIDEAHSNFHTLTGNYKPFADLLRVDGYRLKASATKFTADTFKGIDVFVIVNAEESFTDAEATALHDWVSQGGALLLTADHAPFGAATESLAARFGVGMGKGWAFDQEKPGAITSQLTFSHANGLLGDLSGPHPILKGRDASERISLVKAFTGQSLIMPAGAHALLRFNSTAREAANTRDLNQALEGGGDLVTIGPAGVREVSPSIAGRVQGLAMPFGKGRVVVLGEAGMFSAQVVRFPPGSGQQDVYFGMQVAGTDDRQFALNIAHWLSGALK